MKLIRLFLHTQRAIFNLDYYLVLLYLIELHILNIVTTTTVCVLLDVFDSFTDRNPKPDAQQHNLLITISVKFKAPKEGAIEMIYY